MFYESGAKMSEANYRAGLLHGKTTSFYESGAKKS
jgi:antitoxin component YwqK of YwqJK toxin-antitoxin module